MNGRCCVFQPFDKGPFDKRYEDTVAPAIVAASLEPYRVDRDDGAVIPMDTLHEEIRLATLCFADVTSRNPNVMYELGYAIASDKDVVIICATSQAEKFPFDIQHRGIICYSSDSASDFEKLKNDITNRIKALLRKQETTENIASAVVPLVKSTHGLQPSEVAVLAVILGNIEGQDGVSNFLIKAETEKAGITKAMSQLALIRLTRIGFLEAYEESDYNNDNTWTAYRLLTLGEDWLLTNSDLLEMRQEPRVRPNYKKAPRPLSEGVGDDDVPF